MDKEFEMKILEVIVERRESSYLGIYVMSCFASFDKEIQKILELIESKNEFASWFVGLISVVVDLLKQTLGNNMPCQKISRCEFSIYPAYRQDGFIH